MDRCAVFIDAGYLFAAGGELCCGTRARRRFKLDAAGIVKELASLAYLRCTLPVLRTYWYDGAKIGVPTPSQQETAALPNVKVRLGRLNYRNQQKGVDALIYRDLMTLARERAIADAFLLSGDEDLREGVRAAQDMGVRITLLGIKTVKQDYNQSRELVHEADEVIQLEKADLLPYFSAIQQPVLPFPQEKPQSSNAQAEEIARAFATLWWKRATETEQAAIQGERPRIPQPVDVELLQHAQNQLGLSHISDALRMALRRGFWEAITSAARETTPADGTSEDPTESS